MMITETQRAETSGVPGGPQLEHGAPTGAGFTTGTATLEQLKAVKARRLPRPNRTGPRPMSSGQ